MLTIDEINKNSLAYSINFEVSHPTSEYGAIYYDPLTSLFKKLHSFKELPYNWDGYDAVPLKEEVLINTKNFIKHLPYSVVDDLDSEDIVPTPYGTITIEWSNSHDEYVSVEIGATTIGFFTKFNDLSNPFLVSARFNGIRTPSELDNALSKLLRSK